MVPCAKTRYADVLSPFRLAMSLNGVRETQFDQTQLDITGVSANYTSESNCQRFWMRMITCMRESQHVDVFYDCRSRNADLRECYSRHKQSIWVFRESVASVRNEKKFRQWLRDYDQEFGHPPLLEAVEKVKRKVDAEGGISILHPTHFHDPDLFLAGDVQFTKKNKDANPSV